MGSGPGRLGELNKKRALALAASLDESWVADAPGFHTAFTEEIAALHDGLGRGIVLVLRAGPKAFGSAMVWAAKFEVADLTLMVDTEAGPGDHARRAAAFARPPVVMAVDGAQLVDVAPAPSRPNATVPPPGVDAGMAVLKAAGLDVIVDDGVVVGEYLGLEVARIVPSADGGEVRAGVGAVDQEANRALHGGSDQRELLARVLTEVAAHRRLGAVRHPLNCMARERWLMRTLINDPSLVALGSLVGLPATEPRRGLRVDGPVGATAETPDGMVLVVATTGTDLSLVGVVADLVVREAPNRLLVVSSSSLLVWAGHVLGDLGIAVDVKDVPFS